MKTQNWNTVPVLVDERTKAEDLAGHGQGVVGGLVARMFETTLTVPTHQLTELTRRLAKAGYAVLDTGSRVGTEDGPDAEATVRLVAMAQVQIVDPAHCELGVTA